MAAIAEIIHTTQNCVLVCSQSNSACDEITSRLVDILQDGQIFRMYAKSFDIAKVSAKIRPICNFRNGQFQIPSIKYIYGFRVVITTILTAGCLTRARKLDSAYDSGHFSHVFMDEIAFVHEPVSLIAIAGEYLVVSQRHPNLTGYTHFYFFLYYSQ